MEGTWRVQPGAFHTSCGDIGHQVGQLQPAGWGIKQWRVHLKYLNGAPSLGWVILENIDACSCLKVLVIQEARKPGQELRRAALSLGQVICKVGTSMDSARVLQGQEPGYKMPEGKKQSRERGLVSKHGENKDYSWAISH